MAEIVIGLAEPILARRSEDVEIESVLEGPGFVWHVGGNAENLAGAHDDFLAVDREFESAFENVGELFVVMMMQRDVASFLRKTRASMICWP